MSKIRNSIDNFFKNATELFYDNPKKTILIMLLFIISIVINLPKIQMDTSTEGFLHPDDPQLIKYEEFRDRFGRDELVILAIESENIFSLPFLNKLKQLHEDIESNAPYVDEVTSLINSRNTRSEDSILIVEDLLENIPSTEEQLNQLKKQVLSNPIYKNMNISEDGTFTTIIIEVATAGEENKESNFESDLAGFEEDPSGFEKEDEIASTASSNRKNNLSDMEDQELIKALSPIIKNYSTDDFKIRMVGTPAIMHYLKLTMLKNMRKFMAISLLTVIIMLIIMFRRFSGVILPVFIIIISILSTIGSMAFFGIPLQLPTQILPSFLVAVIVGAVIHALSIFYKELRHNNNKREAIVAAYEHSALPICMTSLTTAAGLLAFTTAELAPITNLGIFASLGIILGLLYTLILLPALISLTPIKTNISESKQARSDAMDKLLLSISHFSNKNAKAIAIIGLIVISGGFYFASQLRFSHNPLIWMPEDLPIRKATALIDKKLKGTTTLEIIIDTKTPGAVKSREFQLKLEEISKELTAYKKKNLFVGKALSVNDLIKEVNRALDNEYKIPNTQPLVSRNFLLFENSGADDMENFVDIENSMCRFTIKLPWLDAIEYGDFVQMTKNLFKEKFGSNVEITITGITALLGRTLKAVMYSTAKSFLIALIVITILMILLLGDLKIGLISMIPNLFPIITGMGIMLLMNIPLDMFTMLIANIAIGLAVDDTIHFMHNFRRYFEKYQDAGKAIDKTFLTAGRAMITTSIVLSIAFFTFTLSEMGNLWNFGFLTGLVIILALVADFFLAPALMTLLVKNKK